jgi:hypothetical protein
MDWSGLLQWLSRWWFWGKTADWVGWHSVCKVGNVLDLPYFGFPSNSDELRLLLAGLSWLKAGILCCTESVEILMRKGILSGSLSSVMYTTSEIQSRFK